MSILDIIILAVVALAMVLGFIKGIVRTLLRFAEIIVTVGMGALAVLILVVTKVVDLESLQGGQVDFAALIIPIAVFLVVAILTMILCDFLIKKYIYRKGHLKRKLVDHCIGMLVAFILTVACIYALFAFIGTFADNYVQLMDLFDQGVIAPFIFNYNPLSPLADKLFANSGVKRVIIAILDMFWWTME